VCLANGYWRTAAPGLECGYDERNP
jgi:hypothetical protein